MRRNIRRRIPGRFVLKWPNDTGGAAPSGLDDRQKVWYERPEIGDVVCPRLNHDDTIENEARFFWKDRFRSVVTKASKYFNPSVNNSPFLMAVQLIYRWY